MATGVIFSRWLKALQAPDDGFLLPVRQHVDQGMVFEVDDDAASAVKVNFIHPHPARGVPLVLGFELCGIFVEDVANGFSSMPICGHGRKGAG